MFGTWSIKMARIIVENLHFAYPDSQPILRGINLEIGAGEFVALVGRNGSGKTTLCKHLNGLLRPSEGRVLLDGRDVQTLSALEIAQIIGYCYQNPDYQITQQTVYDEVAFGPRNLGLPPDEIKQRATEALHAVGLWAVREQPPDLTGKGDRQRIAVASVLAMHPEVLVLDEPTTGLDWPSVQKMMEIILNEQEQGSTIIMITHDMELVATYARRVVVIDGGRISDDASPALFFTTPGLLDYACLSPSDCSVLSCQWRNRAEETTSEVRLESEAPGVESGSALATHYRHDREGLAKLHPSSRLVLCAILAVLPFVFQFPHVQMVILICAALMGVALGMEKWGWRTWGLIGGLGGVLSFVSWIPFYRELRSPAIFRLASIAITPESLLWATAMSLRTAAAALACIVFVSTTTPQEIIIALLGLGVPYCGAYLVARAFRLLPMSRYDSEIIHEAQRVRGLDFSTGRLTERIRNQASVIAPLTVTAMRRIRCIANSLDARGLWARDKMRKPYKMPNWGFLDVATVCGSLALLGIAIWLRSRGVWILMPTRS
jgi:energy-coupling factor transport system ATP-binding protein